MSPVHAYELIAKTSTVQPFGLIAKTSTVQPCGLMINESVAPCINLRTHDSFYLLLTFFETLKEFVQFRCACLVQSHCIEDS